MLMQQYLYLDLNSVKVTRALLQQGRIQYCINCTNKNDCTLPYNKMANKKYIKQK